MIKVCNRIIEYSFYALFLLVPLAFTSSTYELFEMNKMWLTWALTIVIAMAWIIKMVLQRKFFFQRTPLDIPIGLFLISQIISTIFSLDVHVSLWGYYSRFNGGLLSIISYILLYYAFLSNLPEGWRARGTPVEHPKEAKQVRMSDGGEARQDPEKLVKRLLFLSLISGLIVALWGLPSHFGYDPTCLLFRGTFDVSCWTADFIPKIRIFSTLGQPDWLAAYLAILIPISIVYFLKKRDSLIINHFSLILFILFYIDLLFTRARSGILGVWFSLIFFGAAYWRINGKPKISFSKENLKSPFAILFFGFLAITFLIGTPINQLRAFSLEGIGSYFQKPSNTQTQSKAGGLAPRLVPRSPKGEVGSLGEGGTDSANIRLLVWQGAINAWKSNPLFGTGVETFAFAYYKYKPAAQNLTSEWDFLYNKAHNEYLNYLATTGIFGLATYLGMIIMFLVLCIKYYVSSIKKGIHNTYYILLNTGLLAGYTSILVTNFFGFSVVMTNIYLFMIPAFVFVLSGMIKPTTNDQRPTTNKLSPASLTGIFLILVTSLFLLITLFRFWLADIAYALGYNLDRASEYQKAYPNLRKAVELRGDEPVFKDELSINNSILAAGLLAQKPADDQKQQIISIASALTQNSINTSNEVISQHPNNAVFWKTRVRLFYTLSQADPRYLSRALDAIEKASLLAPQDAKIWYNLGVLYGQNNNIEKGISALEKTIILKPNYRDAHYALGLYYYTAALDEKGKVVVNEALNQKAIAQMQYILLHIASQDIGALESITNWNK